MGKRMVVSRQRVLGFAIVIIILIVILRNLFGSQLYGFKKDLQREFGSSTDLDSLMKDSFTSCEGNFVGYGHQFAVLQDAILKPDDEMFYIPCGSKTVPDYAFDYGKEGTHLNTWMKNTVPYGTNKSFQDLETAKKAVGVVVMRYEYANLYHTMTDWFNVFMVVKLLNLSFSDVSVVWYSKHADGHLDETWKTLFGDIIMKTSLERPILFKKMIWCVIGYESPVNSHGLSNLPFVDDFHSFFLQQHGIEHTKKLNCEEVSILFLWRRDYVAHPNNPSGQINRKVKNEKQLLKYFSKRYPSAKVSGQQLDLLTFTEQLQLISRTDILISMHGAGLTHTLFLPKHAGMVEMFTNYWLKFGMTHFRSMARWRGLQYENWQNLNPSNEHEDFYTYIPPASLDQSVKAIFKNMCH